MTEEGRDPLADRLEAQLNNLDDDPRGKVFFAIGYLEQESGKEMQEALGVLADHVSEM